MSRAPDAMRSVVLAGRGLWWRRWSSLAIVVVAAAGAGSAAAGATFAVNAGESSFQAHVRHDRQNSSDNGVTVSISLNGSIALRNYAARVNVAFSALERAGYLGPEIVSESDDRQVVSARPNGLNAPVVYRSGSCAHVSIRAGRCVHSAQPRGVIITRETATNRGWRVGTSFAVGYDKHPTTLRVVGIYEPAAPSGSYWSENDQQYFGVVGRASSLETPHLNAVLVPASFWALPGQSSPSDPPLATMHFTLLPSRLQQSNVGLIKAMLTEAYARMDRTFGAGVQIPTVDTQLPAVLDRAKVAARSISGSVLDIEAQIADLTCLVLFLLLASSVEARTNEVVIGKLRGLNPRQTWLHAMLEPFILVVVAVPVGVAGCAVALHLIGGSVLGYYVHPVLPRSAWLAAAWAGLAGVAACVLTTATIVGRSPVDLRRSSGRRFDIRGWVVPAVIGTLALAGFVELVRAHASLGAGPEFLASSAPGLLAVTLALAGIRLASAAPRPWQRSRRTSTVIAVRRLAGHAADRRVFVLLTMAVTLVVFCAASRSVLETNQRNHALAELGATRVITVRAARGVDTAAAVAAIDPSGHLASAVYVGSLAPSDAVDPSTATGAAPTLMIVDPPSFSSVAFWRSDFGASPRLTHQLSPLAAPPPALVEVRGATLRVTATVRDHTTPVELHVGFTDDSGRVEDVALGAIAPTRSRTSGRVVHFAVGVPRCAGVCRFRRFSLSPGSDDQSLPRVSVVVTSMAEVSAPGTARSLLAALRATTWTSPDNAAGGARSVTVATTGGRLSIDFLPQFIPADSSAGYETDSSDAPAVPAIVSADLLPQPPPSTISVQPEQGLGLTIAPTRVEVMPGAGNGAVVISRAWLAAARPDGYDAYQPNQVWLSARAPADFAHRLRAAGVSVLEVRTAGALDNHLAGLGAVYSTDMPLYGAAAAAVLAAAGLITSLLLASRRRLDEVAALRALIRPVRVSAVLIVEQVATAAVASVLGLAAGVIGARAALERLTRSTGQPRFPSLARTVPLGVCSLVALAMFALIIACAVIGCAGLVSRASPGKMRGAGLELETRVEETLRILGCDGSGQPPTIVAGTYPPGPRGGYTPHPEDLEVYEVPNPTPKPATTPRPRAHGVMPD